MTQQIKIVLDSSEKQAVKSTETLEKSVKDLGDSYDKTSKMSVAGAKATTNSIRALKQELKEQQAILDNTDRNSAEFENQQRVVARLRKEVAGTKTEMDGLAGASTGVAGNMKSAVGSAVTMTAVIGSASAILTGVLDKATAAFRETERRQRDAFLATASVQEVLAVNQGNFAEALDDVAKRALIFSQDEGVDQRQVIDAFSRLNSQVGAIAGPELQEEAFREAFQITRDAENSVDRAAAAVRRSAEDGQATIEEIREMLGSGLALQTVLPTPNAAVFLKNIESAVGAGVRERRELAAPGSELTQELAAFLSGRAADIEGRETATFLVGALDKLGDLTLKPEVTLPSGEVLKATPEQIAEVRATRDLIDKLELIGQSTALTEQVIKQLPAGKIRGGFEALIRGDETSVAVFENIRDTVVTGREAAGILSQAQAETAESAADFIAQQRKVSDDLTVQAEASRRTLDKGRLQGQRETLEQIGDPGILFDLFGGGAAAISRLPGGTQEELVLAEAQRRDAFRQADTSAQQLTAEQRQIEQRILGEILEQLQQNQGQPQPVEIVNPAPEPAGPIPVQVVNQLAQPDPVPAADIP